MSGARLVNDAQFLAWTLMNRAWIALTSGGLETALRAAEESAGLVDDFDDSAVSNWSAGILGVVLAEAGEATRGLEIILAGTGGPELPLVAGNFRVINQERIVQAWLALGDRAEARTAAVRAETAAAALGLDRARSAAQRVRDRQFEN